MFCQFTSTYTVLCFSTYKKSNHQMVIAFLVRETGLEPVRVAPHAPQTCASADSATLASTVRSITEPEANVNTFFEFFSIFQNKLDMYFVSSIITDGCSAKSVSNDLNPHEQPTASIFAFFAVFISTSLSPKKIASVGLQSTAESALSVVVGSGFVGSPSTQPVI